MARSTPPSSFQPALPDREDAQQIAAKLVEIVDHIEDTGPHDAGDERIQGCVGDVLRIGRKPPAQVANDRHRGQKSDDHHQAVALDGHVDQWEFEQFGVHLAAYPPATMRHPSHSMTAPKICPFHSTIPLLSSSTTTLGLSSAASSGVHWANAIMIRISPT